MSAEEDKKLAFHRRICCAYLYIITRHGYPPDPAATDTHLAEMSSLGFQSVELEGIHPKSIAAMYERRHQTRETAQRLGLEIPLYCVVLPGLSSADRTVRESSLGHFERGCDTAVALGARGVLDNAPIPPYVFAGDMPVVRHYDDDVLLSAPLPPELYWPEYWSDLVDTYRTACRIAGERGLSYQMHPCLGALASTTDAFVLFRDAVGADNLHFNLDTANQHVFKDSLILSLRRLSESIDYIHLSDSRGTTIEHLPPGDGTINWPRFFATLAAVGFDGSVGIDVGGHESGVTDLDRAYRRSAEWLQRQLSLTDEKRGA